MGTPSAGLVRIGSVARSAGLSTDAVRHYERLGLLQSASRTEGGFRLYETASLRRVQVIQAALRAGFSLKELSEIFAERRAGRAPCRRVRAMAAEKLATVEKELRRLGQLRRALRQTLIDWDERLTRAPSGQMVGLLEALATAMAVGKGWPGGRQPEKRPLRGRSRTEEVST
jgi:MerR family transcriptional regulator, copper efflux regulator